MFPGNFVKVVMPVVLGGFFMAIAVPGLVKLIPIIIVVGVIWSTYHVAKGFDLADRQRGGHRRRRRRHW